MTIAELESFSSYVPISLISFQGFISAILILIFFILFRYFLIVGFVHIWIYKLKTKSPKMHNFAIARKQFFHEIKWSLVSSIIFALSGYTIGVMWELNLTQIYLDFDKFGLWYLPTSFFIYSILHEFYFTLTHIWMHKPKIYKKVHHIHHISHKVSPWASFSFHPWETLVHAVFFPAMILFVPIHPIVVICYFTFMTLTAVSNHSGVEFLRSSPLKSLFISGEHHHLHHHLYRGNYGLFYTFSDKLFKTEITNYPQELGETA